MTLAEWIRREIKAGNIIRHTAGIASVFNKIEDGVLMGVEGVSGVPRNESLTLDLPKGLWESARSYDTRGWSAEARRMCNGILACWKPHITVTIRGTQYKVHAVETIDGNRVTV